MSYSTNDQENSLFKAGVLAEALPWLIKFQDSIVVIKFGGNAMINKTLMKQFAEDIVFLKLAGLNPVVIHGAGPQITKALEEAGIKSEFKNGYRVTDKKSISIIKDVLKNKVQKEIVNEINALKDFAIGISGDENNLIRVNKLVVKKDDLVQDLGYVGEVIQIDKEQILNVIKDKKIPIISCLGVNENGEIYNINADHGACAIAKFLKANKIVLLTDVLGLLAKFPDEKSLISNINATELEEMIPNLDAGMRPKMEACLNAIQNGVSRAHVIDGRKPHALLVEVFTDSGTGTMITKGLKDE